LHYIVPHPQFGSCQVHLAGGSKYSTIIIFFYELRVSKLLVPEIGKAECFIFLTGHYRTLVQASVLVSVFQRNILLPSSGLKHTSLLQTDSCTFGTHQSYHTALQSAPTNHTVQLYSRYPPIIPHSCTVGTQQSYRAAVQSVPTNHTAQLYSRYPPNIPHSFTVGTHQSYRTAVQSVPTNHTVQHQNCPGNINPVNIAILVIVFYSCEFVGLEDPDINGRII